MYVYDNTVANPNYVFTPYDIAEKFGNSSKSSRNIITKLKVFGNVSEVGTKGFRKAFMITEDGKKYALRLKSKMEAKEKELLKTDSESHSVTLEALSND